MNRILIFLIFLTLSCSSEEDNSSGLGQLRIELGYSSLLKKDNFLFQIINYREGTLVKSWDNIEDLPELIDLVPGGYSINIEMDAIINTWEGGRHEFDYENDYLVIKRDKELRFILSIHNPVVDGIWTEFDASLITKEDKVFSFTLNGDIYFLFPERIGSSFLKYSVGHNEWEYLNDLPFLYDFEYTMELDNYGYVVSSETNGDELNGHLFIYDPNFDKWDRLDAPVEIVSTTTQFGIDSKIYFGGGIDDPSPFSVKFLYFDQSSLNWGSISDFPGKPFRLASTFTLNGKGYLVGGENLYGESYECWQYNPDTNSWHERAEYPGWSAYGNLSIESQNLGYFGLGSTSPRALKGDLWSYDEETNNWIFYTYYQHPEMVVMTKGSSFDFAYFLFSQTDSSVKLKLIQPI